MRGRVALEMDALVRRHFRILVMCMIAVAAYFQADGLKWLLLSELIVATPIPPPPRSITVPGELLHDTSAAAILSRNPFDSVTGPLDVEPIRLPAPPWNDDPYADAPCNPTTRVTLIAASGVEDTSFAAIAVGRGKARLYRPGDTVSGHTVLHVAWDRVWLTGKDGRCQLELHAEREPPAPPPAPVRRRRRSAAALPPPIASKIHRISETEVEVERAAVDLVLERPAELMKRTRVAPWKRDGEVLGIRMQRIGSGGLLHTLGFRRGDIIRAINGRSIADPEQALEAYARLRTAERLEVAIERDGKPTTLEVSIR